MPARCAVPILAIIALASCWTFQARGRVPFTSDQAIVALMADDIREKGAHPVFYYGSEYAGTLEPHYLALVFAIFGASPLAFRGGMAVLVVLAVLLSWATAREAFGDRAGLAAGLYLALGPSFFLYKGLTSDGAYTSLLVLSTASLWLMLVVEARFRRAQPATVPVSGLGFVLGIAWWVHAPSAFLGPVVAAAALTGSSRRWLSPRVLALLLASFFAGSAPWWIRNYETGMGSLRAAEMTASQAGRFAAQARGLVLDGWSILLGARSAWSTESAFPGAGLVALVMLALVLGFGLWSAVRGATVPARLGATLCVTAMASLSALCLMVSRTDFTEPRYLFAGYAGLAPLVGGLFQALWPRRSALLALAIAVLALNLGSQAKSPLMKHADAGRPFTGEYDLEPVFGQLRAQGIRSVYTSYWIAYRMTFVARGEIVASPLGPTGPNGAVRIAETKRTVDRDPRPGFLLHGEDLESMRAFLSSRAIVSRHVAFPGFALYWGFPEATLEVLKRCNCIPATVRPREVAVVSAAGPERVPAGGMAHFRVTVRNDSPRPLSDNVHLGTHWIRLDGSVAQWDGERASNVRWPRGTVTVEFAVPVTVSAGEYDVVFDLVDEGVTWFERLGTRNTRHRVVVEPPGGG